MLIATQNKPLYYTSNLHADQQKTSDKFSSARRMTQI